MAIKQGKASRKEFKKFKAQGGLFISDRQETIIAMPENGDTEIKNIHTTTEISSPEAKSVPTAREVIT